LAASAPIVAENPDRWAEQFSKVVNEIHTCLLIAIVVLVAFKPLWA